MSDKSLEEQMTDKAGTPVAKAAGERRPHPERIPGPSTNPATNMLIADIALRSAGRIVRNSMQKGMLRAGFDRDAAREIVDSRTMLSSLILYGASKIATRSVPGALLVGGGLIAKTLYDRGLTRHEARRRGDMQIEAMTDEDVVEGDR